MQADELHEDPEPSGAVSGPTAEASDPVLEVFKRDIDFSLVEKNLRLSTEERAQQLLNATRFLKRFRPLVPLPRGRTINRRNLPKDLGRTKMRIEFICSHEGES